MRDSHLDCRAAAVHVADITVLARECPETPATEVFPEEDIDPLHTMLEAQGHRNVVRRPEGQIPDILAVVSDIGRLVGSHPNPSRPRKKSGRDSKI